MYLYIEINLMQVYLLFLLLSSASFSDAEQIHNNDLMKSKIVGEILKKISNETIYLLSSVPDDRKKIILNKIEQKLKRTAEGLVDGDKYVKYIMEEFKNKAYNKKQSSKKYIKQHDHEHTKERVKITNNKVATTKEAEEIFRSNKLKEKVEGMDDHRKIFNTQTKQHIITDIANKIEKMAKGYLRTTQNQEEKKRILKKIEKRIVESSKRKHMQIHQQHSELKAYADLISQGLDLSIRRLLAPKSRRSDNVEYKKQHDSKSSSTTERNAHEINMENIEHYKKFFSQIWNETSIDPRCSDEVDQICLRIGSLHKLSCGDGKVVSLEQLCDGVADCWNEADEVNCIPQAIDKIQHGIKLMTDIDKSITTKCLQPIVDVTIFGYHHRILQTMLNTQLTYLQNFKSQTHRPSDKPGDLDIHLEEDVDSIFIKKIIGDASIGVSSISYVLEANLCSPETNKQRNFTRKLLNIEPEETTNILTGDELLQVSKWSPKSCICKDQSCKSDDCDRRCKRICWQKYILNHWECQSSTGGTSVSLDLLCDGKLDCVDESDEISCAGDPSRSKSEANNMYNEVLNKLITKSSSKEYEISRNKIAAGISLVRHLQKLTTKSELDIQLIKSTRNNYFKMLIHIYGDMLQTSNLEQLDNIHEMLLEWKEKMVLALKRSHTGNELVLASSGCYCNNGSCALIRCPRKCIATCRIEPIIMKYSCNVNTSATVHFKAICNGRKDCPGGEDEQDCQTEVCRAHHLVLLRLELQKVGTGLKSSAIGVAVDEWKAKVLNNLRTKEETERPNHLALEDVVYRILHDLVTTFASLEETRRNNSDMAISEFKNISDVIKKSLKSCMN